jgi:hypothetical protein
MKHCHEALPDAQTQCRLRAGPLRPCAEVVPSAAPAEDVGTGVLRLIGEVLMALCLSFHGHRCLHCPLYRLLIVGLHISWWHLPPTTVPNFNSFVNSSPRLLSGVISLV